MFPNNFINQRQQQRHRTTTTTGQRKRDDFEGMNNNQASTRAQPPNLTYRMIKCRDCGKNVPEKNMAIHTATGCRPGDYGLADSMDEFPVARLVGARVPTCMEVEEIQDSKPPAVVATPIPREAPIVYPDASAPPYEVYEVPSAAAYPSVAAYPSAYSSPTTCPSVVYPTPADPFACREPSRTRSRTWKSLSPPALSKRRFSNKSDDSFVHVNEIVNLADESSSSSEESDSIDAEWSCPRCTLLNPITRQICEACEYDKTTVVLPDRDNTISRNSSTSSSESSISISSNYNNIHQQRVVRPTSRSHILQEPSVRAADPVRRERLVDDQPNQTGTFMGGGAFLGSMVGAAGAFVRGTSVRNGALEGAVGGAVGGALVHEVLRDVAPTRRQQRGHSQRSIRQTFPTQTIRVSHRPTGTGYTTQISTYGDQDAVMDALMNSLLLQQSGGRNDEDGMNYDDLLDRYGDGTEDWRGLEPRTINALPRELITKHNCGSCSICLEQFEPGQYKRILPCFHGFHDHCADHWLSTNAVCPICKHEL